MQNNAAHIICESAALIDGSKAMRFDQIINGKIVACFAMRYESVVYAYRNSCPHRFTELDWQPGEMFEESGRYLICATHGALFEPDSGTCVMGPCKGVSLIAVAVKEEQGVVLAA